MNNTYETPIPIMILINGSKNSQRKNFVNPDNSFFLDIRPIIMKVAMPPSNA